MAKNKYESQYFGADVDAAIEKAKNLGMFKGTVLDADALNKASNIGVYYLTSNTLHSFGLLNVGYNAVNSRVTQTFLSSTKPVYNTDGTIKQYDNETCLLTREWEGTKWSKWESAKGGEFVALSGFKYATSTSDLPETPTKEQQTIGYIVGTRLYVYVGTGGDTLGGKYKDVGEFKGPKGNDGEKGEQGEQGPVGPAGDTTAVEAYMKQIRDEIHELPEGSTTMDAKVIKNEADISDLALKVVGASVDTGITEQNAVASNTTGLNLIKKDGYITIVGSNYGNAFPVSIDCSSLDDGQEYTIKFHAVCVDGTTEANWCIHSFKTPNAQKADLNNISDRYKSGEYDVEVKFIYDSTYPYIGWANASNLPDLTGGCTLTISNLTITSSSKGIIASISTMQKDIEDLKKGAGDDKNLIDISKFTLTNSAGLNCSVIEGGIKVIGTNYANPYYAVIFDCSSLENGKTYGITFNYELASGAFRLYKCVGNTQATIGDTQRIFDNLYSGRGVVDESFVYDSTHPYLCIPSYIRDDGQDIHGTGNILTITDWNLCEPSDKKKIANLEKKSEDNKQRVENLERTFNRNDCSISNVLTLGDSITAITGNWTEEFARIVRPKNHYNSASGGCAWVNDSKHENNNIKNLIDQAVGQVSSQGWDKVDVVVIALGINDRGSVIGDVSELHKPLDNADIQGRVNLFAAINYGIRRLRAEFNYPQIYLQTPQYTADWSGLDKIDEMCEYIITAARLMGCIVIDARYNDLGPATADKTYPANDGLHPNAYGSKKQGVYNAGIVMGTFRKMVD